MSGKYWIRIALGMLVVFAAGLVAIGFGKRARTVTETVWAWADSLEHGSGPVAMRIPFVPVYVDGDRIGTLDSLVVLRHAADSVDGLRVVVKPRDLAHRKRLEACVLELVSVDNFHPKEALRCESDTTGLAPFGHLVFGTEGMPLFVRVEELAHAPWVRHRVEAQHMDSVARVMDSVARQLEQQIRTEVQQSVRKAVPAKPPAPPKP